MIFTNQLGYSLLGRGRPGGFKADSGAGQRVGKGSRTSVFRVLVEQ